MRFDQVTRELRSSPATPTLELAVAFMPVLCAAAHWQSSFIKEYKHNILTKEVMITRSSGLVWDEVADRETNGPEYSRPDMLCNLGHTIALGPQFPHCFLTLVMQTVQTVLWDSLTLDIKETIINYFTGEQKPSISQILAKWIWSKCHGRSYSKLCWGDAWMMDAVHASPQLVPFFSRFLKVFSC